MAPQSPRLRMLQGDEAELFRTYEVALRAAVRHHILASDEVIEDACSYAWLELCWRQPDRDNVFAWLLLVATRQAWRNRERDQRERSLTEVPPDREPQRADLSREVDAHEALHALSNLPSRQRDYLTLLTTGYSYHEIASLRDVSYTAVNRHLTRARRNLRLVHDAD